MHDLVSALLLSRFRLLAVTRACLASCQLDLLSPWLSSHYGEVGEFLEAGSERAWT
jgi:hypothetical protein